MKHDFNKINRAKDFSLSIFYQNYDKRKEVNLCAFGSK